MAGGRERTLYIVAYDISNDRRRYKIHRTLCGFGSWTQYSLFECFLNAKELLQLQERLNQYVEPEEDSLRFYPLCQACLKRVETIGSEEPKQEVAYVV